MWSSKHFIFICPEYLNVLPFQVDKIVYICSEVFTVSLKHVLVSDVRLKKRKQARAGQIILSGILPVFGNKIHGYRNSKRMAVNGMVKRLCKEEELGYVDLWDSFVGKEEMYASDGLHLSGKGAAVFAEVLLGAVASGLGKVSYLN